MHPCMLCLPHILYFLTAHAMECLGLGPASVHGGLLCTLRSMLGVALGVLQAGWRACLAIVCTQPAAWPKLQCVTWRSVSVCLGQGIQVGQHKLPVLPAVQMTVYTQPVSDAWMAAEYDRLVAKWSINQSECSTRILGFVHACVLLARSRSPMVPEHLTLLPPLPIMACLQPAALPVPQMVSHARSAPALSNQGWRQPPHAQICV